MAAGKIRGNSLDSRGCSVDPVGAATPTTHFVEQSTYNSSSNFLVHGLVCMKMFIEHSKLCARPFYN